MIKLDIQDADFYYYPQFISNADSSIIFVDLIQNVPWVQEEVFLYGKHSVAPRHIALFGRYPYTYGGKVHCPLPDNEHVETMLDIVNRFTKHSFNSVLLNLYTSGKDYIGFHSDNEPQLGKNPTIASLSFGLERIFYIKHKTSGKLHKILLEHGSLLVMGNNSQTLYSHSLPKMSKLAGTRLNLTFRTIL